MSDTVRPRGIDSSGRAILATDFMWDFWLGVCDRLGFEPVITQGAWMSRIPGGGAEGSSGYHDGGGCFDLRTWNLTAAGLDTTIRVLRQHGAAAWRRDERHGGFDDPHIHFVLGSDQGLTTGAKAQWVAYLNGRDGLASNGPDYEARPHPLVLEPPEVDDMPAPKDWDDKDKAVVTALIAAELDRPVDTKKGKRSLRQMVKEMFQR